MSWGKDVSCTKDGEEEDRATASKEEEKADLWKVVVKERSFHFSMEWVD